MATQLYETLEIDCNATPEQIRKAYKKKALQTHPDRLPRGSTEADKAAAEEQFRKVNNAYEVLIDPQKRKVYDTRGMWPPQEPDAPPANNSGRRDGGRGFSPFPSPFSDPFFNAGSRSFFGNSRNQNRPFTDPFTLFSSIFGDLDRHFNDQFNDPFFSDLNNGGRYGGNGFSSRERQSAFPPSMLSSPFSSHLGLPDFNGMGRSASCQSQSFGFLGGPDANGTRWTSASRSTTTINGVTQSKWTRRDSDGNEHTTYTYPDGRTRYLLNGVEHIESSQPPRNDRYIQSPPRRTAFPSPPAVPPPPATPAVPTQQAYAPPPGPLPRSYTSSTAGSTTSRHHREHNYPYNEDQRRRSTTSEHRAHHDGSRERHAKNHEGRYGDSSWKFWQNR